MNTTARIIHWTWLALALAGFCSWAGRSLAAGPQTPAPSEVAVIGTEAARPLEHLSTGGRPLSGGIEALREMEIQRAPLYRAASRAVIQNTGTIERAARAAMEGFYEAAGD